MIGPTIRHGPHHGAQQSTRTARPLACTTSRSKVWSVMIIGFESCSFPAPPNSSPHRPHFAWLVASLFSSTRFFAPHLLQTITCIRHLHNVKPQSTTRAQVIVFTSCFLCLSVANNFRAAMLFGGSSRVDVLYVLTAVHRQVPATPAPCLRAHSHAIAGTARPLSQRTSVLLRSGRTVCHCRSMVRL